jgi:hypothetical protein
MTCVVCAGRAKDLSGRQLRQHSQFCTGGCEEKRQLEESWKAAAVQGGLEHGSRGIAIVRSRYQETFSEDTADL